MLAVLNLLKQVTVSNGIFARVFGIKSLAIAEEKASMDNVSADKLISSFNTLMDKSSLDQIFNCDETGLLYKILPGCTLTTIHNDPSRTKKSKGTCNY